MKTFLDTAASSLIGAGAVLVVRHLFIAIWGHPKSVISVRKTSTSPLQTSKVYYRSWKSWIATIIAISGFVVGGGLAMTLWEPLEQLGLEWCPPLIAAGMVVMTARISMKFDTREIQKLVDLHATQNNREGQQDSAPRNQR